HHELDERIARLTELRLVALALEADRLPILHESRQLDRKLAPIGEYGCHLGGRGDLFDSDAERDIHIAHALRPSAATRTTSTSAGKSIAEQLAENVARAKTAATAKLEMVALPAATLAECGKWVALRAAFEAVEAWPPCFVDLAIVELPALRFIAEDFVGLADLGKTLLRLRIVGPLVGVEFLRQPAESRLYLLFGRTLLHAQNIVWTLHLRSIRTNRCHTRKAAIAVFPSFLAYMRTKTGEFQIQSRCAPNIRRVQSSVKDLSAMIPRGVWQAVPS